MSIEHHITITELEKMNYIKICFKINVCFKINFKNIDRHDNLFMIFKLNVIKYE